MTLKTIVADALAEVTGTAIPASIANSTDPTAIKALAMLNGIGRDLSKSYRWPELKATYTFNTVPNQPGYPLPADFRRFSPLTQWDRTNHWPFMGSATDSFWQMLQSGFITFGMRFWFRVEGSDFVIGPTPTDVREIAFDYYKNTWVKGADGTFKTKFTDDADVPIFLPNGEAEDTLRLGLLYRFKASNSQPYQEDKANYLASIEADTFDASSPPLIDVSGIRRGLRTRGNIPDFGYGV